MSAVVSICYKHGVPFNEEYYLKSHMPRAAELSEALGVRGVRVSRQVGAPAGGPAPYQIITTLHFDSMESAKACLTNPLMGPLVDDVKNFYNGMPEISIGEVLLEG